MSITSRCLGLLSSMASSPVSPRSPRSPSEDVLTPTRKVKALLARFDDSDSDTAASPKASAARSGEFGKDRYATTSQGSEDEEDLPINIVSRMTARLRGKKQIVSRHASDPQPAEAENESESQQEGLRHPEEEQTSQLRPIETSEDDLTRPAPRRRLLLKRKSGSAAPSSPAGAPLQPPSPLFFPSPNADRTASMPNSPPAQSHISSRSSSPPQHAGSKFKALVEKHRKARLEKEAAEVAKRAAVGKPSKQQTEKTRKPRGSSPADDSDEGSDDSNTGAACRLTKEAKPTRKASKKAMEEMKRETQRMSRNMQLAHQARTKKKITKESLLARFNFTMPTVAAQSDVTGNHSATASSEVGSDAEALKHNETPPTSPLRDPFDSDKPLTEQVLLEPELVSESASNLVVEPPTLDDLGLDIPFATDKGKGKAMDWAPQKAVRVSRAISERPPTRADPGKPTQGGKFDLKAKVAELLKSQRATSDLVDSDDLDVITRRGSKRKFAAFERLPKRKARETPSHLALRSLAHIHDNERNNHSSMSQSEMHTSLRKAARMQAMQERQQKIAELKAKGVVIQSAEDRERDQQEVEDLVERARKEAAEISKREKAMAKKDGTFVKDGLDDDDSDDDEFEEELEEEAEAEQSSDAESEDDGEGVDDGEEQDAVAEDEGRFVDDAADEADSGEETLSEVDEDDGPLDKVEGVEEMQKTPASRRSRALRFVVDDEDELLDTAAVEPPALPQPVKTPQSLSRSARKQIPGLQISDDLPLGLTQAFAATMADSQSQDEQQTQQQDTLRILRDLPSPNISMAPQLNRLDSLDIISDSQPAAQTQPLDINLSFSQPQPVPESPSLVGGIAATQFTPSQQHFEPTQDRGYMFSPFQGSRFASETPQHHAPHSTVETVIALDAVDAGPILPRKGRLQRGRAASAQSDDKAEDVSADQSAFEIMRSAAKKADEPVFDKSKSNARNVVDEAAEESDDEYAGLGGASDDDLNDQENEDDREMIDHDTQVGKGDEAKLAGLFADRERKNDEAAVSKLLKDITTGALRRNRGANDDLDLSDEEDAVARRREAKRREFAKMRRELLKDEAVGKIAEDKKKEAFLKSIEDREPVSDDDNFDEPEIPLDESQDKSQPLAQVNVDEAREDPREEKRKRPLEPASDSQLNRIPPSLRRVHHNNKPATLAEIRESVSFLIEEPDSQANTIDLGLSDSEDEPEAYVDLDRHLKAAEADENAALDSDDDDLDDFIVDDDGLAEDHSRSESQDSVFKKPSFPSQTSSNRPSFQDRRTTRTNVINRLSLLRQSSSTLSSSSTTSSTTRLAFYSTTATNTSSSTFKTPFLLRRATTNSSLTSSSENISATGVTTSRTERGHVSGEKEFIRKGTGGRRNAVNYRPTVKEERMSARAGVQKSERKKKGGAGQGGFLGGLFRGESWG